MNNGSFVISLDYELMWGVRDNRSIDNYGDAILGVRPAIDRMITSFEKYGAKATFATVGFLFCKDKKELMQNLPNKKVEYHNNILSPYPNIHSYVGDNEDTDPYHFGFSLLQKIKASNHIELATHTFCHYYCLEPGQNISMFESDLEAAIKVAALEGIETKSIVFPRNQYNETYVDLCGKMGITSYRGNEDHYIYKSSNSESQTPIRRALRLLDSFVNITGYHTYSYESLRKSTPFNIPSSRLLRPYSKKLSWLQPLKIKRITQAMTHAAKNNEVFHLWWHPHNFGRNLEANISILDAVLAHYQELNKKYGFQAATMQDVAHYLSK